MKIRSVRCLSLIGLLVAALCQPVFATVQILSIIPSPQSPQVIGTTITWSATATDTHKGPVFFRLYVTAPGGHALMVRDFLPGTFSSSGWTSQFFPWMPAACTNLMSGGVDAFTCEPIEGFYTVEVVAKDFASSETATRTTRFQVAPLVTGSMPVIKATANPLVSIFGVLPCTSGSSVRASFRQQSGATPATVTNWMPCRPTTTSNFEIAGVYPNTTYKISAQTVTGGKIVNGPTLTYQTGVLPSTIKFPTFAVRAASSPNNDQPVIFHNLIELSGGAIYPSVATDLAGKLIWYYFPNDDFNTAVITRPLQNGTFLSFENAVAWNPAATTGQLLRQVDLAGNVIRETNTGVIQQELLAMGATDAQACSAIPKPPPVGAACLGQFHHDAIQSLPPTVNSTQPGPFTAVLVNIEKIFPPGTQGDTSGLPVDVIGDMIVVLDSNWNAVWYFDAFQHDGGCPQGGGPCQLDINRAAVLHETCGTAQSGCPTGLLLGAGVSPLAMDWLHANSLYYWANDTFGGASKDILWSSRHQDWVMKIDYQDGSPNATGNLLWRMGNQGDFTLLGSNDPWPWFSHQHDAGIENNGGGVMTVFDNGNTRISLPPIGLGGVPGCLPYDCDSRGMALTFTEVPPMQATPVLSLDLGYFSTAMGSAQLLSSGDYFFQPALVITPLGTTSAHSIQVAPTPPIDVPNVLLDLQGPEHYRGWQMTSMYFPPTT